MTELEDYTALHFPELLSFCDYDITLGNLQRWIPSEVTYTKTDISFET